MINGKLETVADARGRLEERLKMLVAFTKVVDNNRPIPVFVCPGTADPATKGLWPVSRSLLILL